jgi:hypothetical protein
MQGVFPRAAAHFCRRLQPTAEGWPSGHAEQRALQIRRQLHAGHTGRLALRHAWKRAIDRGRNAAGRASSATAQHVLPTPCGATEAAHAGFIFSDDKIVFMQIDNLFV